MMNKEEMRQARLRALGIEDRHDNVDSDHAEKKERVETIDPPAAGRDSSGIAQAAPIATDRERVAPSPLCPEVLASASELLISDNAQQEDMARWFSQGCEFIDIPNYCLKQTHGGPCGVLAAIQAEMLKSIYFGDRTELQPVRDQITSTLSEEQVHYHFSSALLSIFKRAAMDRSIVMVFSELSDISTGSWPQNMQVQHLWSDFEFRQFVSDKFTLYKSMSGCFLIILSLVLTRGIEEVASDMDDRGNGLIGNFGHCNQELVNLLLTGQASSNVFDGTKPLGDSGLVLRGLKERNEIGYLTHLESMRYCQVGCFYKVPVYPIWLVGSSSHFTVLFSLANEVNEETEEEVLLSRVKREFRQADFEENGYISVDRLAIVLAALDIDVERMTVEEFNSLKLLLDPESCGIILFGVIWSVVSQLMSGGRIDQLLEKFSTGGPPNAEIMALAPRERSDSDIARALQEEWSNGEASISTPPAVDVAASVPSNIPRSDSDLARVLQEEWNSGQSQSSPSFVSPQNINTPSVGAGSLDIMSIVNAVSTPAPSSASAVKKSGKNSALQGQSGSLTVHHDSVADKDSQKFMMYHYNGLSTTSSPQMISFELQKRASVNDVGQQIAMDIDFGSAGMSGSDFEELLRTRWPGCRLSWSTTSRPRLD